MLQKTLLLFLALGVIFFGDLCFAQTTLFYEHIGTSGAAANPAITAFNGFRNSGCSYTFAGTGDVRNSSPSSGYTGASGINNVFLPNGGNRTFIISGINTLAYSSLSLSYGLFKSTGTLINPNGSGFVVEVSTDGVNYTALTRPGGTWGATWRRETCTGTIPSTANLFIRFTNTSGILFGTQFRIDDLTLTGTPSAFTNPSAYTGWPTSYSFNSWASTNTGGTYPPNMIFHYGNVNVIHPVLGQVNASQDYALAYNLICSSRISGQGTNGISFLNINPGNATVTTGNLGEAVLALNTTCRSNIQVSWRAGTQNNHSVPYRLRAQYRVGTTGVYSDLPNAVITQIEYTSPGLTTNFGPVILPAACENQSVVQVRWVFYWGGAGAGMSDEIFLTNISISSDPVILYSVTGGGNYCSGGSGVAIGLSSSQSGVNYQLYNGASVVGSALAGTGTSLSFGNQTAAGTYTVLATNVISSCTAAMSGNAIVVINPLPTVNSVSNQSACGGKPVSVNFSSTPPGASFSWSNSNPAIGLASPGSGNISYTTPSLAVSDETGVVSVTAALNGCTGPSSAFSVTVKAPQASSIWTGALSTNWLEHDNWTNCVCGSVTDVTISAVSNPSFNPVIASTTNIKNLTLNSGAQLSIQNTQTLHLHGNWTNNGVFNAQQGHVILSGSTLQNIGGTSITSFYDLTLNNSSGAALSSSQEIKGSLQLTSGVFNTNNLLTLAADASGSGRIGPINANADIINQVTVQQHAQGGTTGWALLGKPLSSSLTMADWNDDFAITCQSCPNGYPGNFTSVYSYDETVAGSYSASAKYIPITSISDNIAVGKAYWIYLGNGMPNTTAINFDVSGTIAKSTCLSCSGPVTIPVSFTSNNGIADDGWNLISNPLPSPISWSALRNGNTNVDNAVYCYNADLNGGLGAHTSYINGISSDISGGITDNIPMCQGFYIHATAPTVLTAGENIKTNTNPVFLRPALVARPVLRLALEGSSGFKDMTTFYFEQGGSLNFQTDFDAYKLNFDVSYIPYIAGISDSLLTSISGLPQLTSNFSVAVTAITPANGSFTFSAIEADFPDDVCVSLYDAYTGITTNILNSTYSCLLYDTTSGARFSLRFFTTPLAGTGSVSQPGCHAPNGGMIVAMGNNGGPWNYEWKSGNAIIKTSLNKSTGDSLVSLSGGNYMVKINTVGQCDHYVQAFAVDTIFTTTASFVPNTYTTFISNAGQVSFFNNSSNAQFNSWDFGDGSGTSNLSHPSYHYTSPGVYTITLITESQSFCTDTAHEVIMVMDDVAGISGFKNDTGIVLASLSAGLYDLKFLFNSSTDVKIRLFDLKGNALREQALYKVVAADHLLDLSLFSQGMYLLKVNTGRNTEKVFKLVR